MFVFSCAMRCVVLVLFFDANNLESKLVEFIDLNVKKPLLITKQVVQ